MESDAIGGERGIERASGGAGSANRQTDAAGREIAMSEIWSVVVYWILKNEADRDDETVTLSFASTLKNGRFLLREIAIDGRSRILDFFDILRRYPSKFHPFFS